MACNSEDILLYIEGELGPEEAARVRAHTAVCQACHELLLTEQALESALGGLRGVEPPPDFATATVRRAECDVTHALHSSGERRRAALVAMGLAVLALMLWPAGVYGSVLSTVAPVRCLGRFAMNWIENTAFSVFIVCRTLSRNMLEESSLSVGAVLLVLVLLVALLAWLISGYHKHARSVVR